MIKIYVISFIHPALYKYYQSGTNKQTNKTFILFAGLYFERKTIARKPEAMQEIRSLLCFRW